MNPFGDPDAGQEAESVAAPIAPVPVVTVPVAAAPSFAVSHPDVRVALSSLRTALRKAAPDPSMAGPIGKKRLRDLIKLTRKQSDQPLRAHSLTFYKDLVSSLDGGRNTGVASSLAALAQRAAAEGYDAVVERLVRQTLDQRLQSLPITTLCELARLKDTDDRTRERILSKTTDLLGANKHGPAHKVEQAHKQAEVAAALLSVVAELCHEHFRNKMWDQQIAIALSAASQGQHQQLDTALREMWTGDLLMGGTDLARVHRLAESVKRLPKDQQNKLAAMLGLATTPSIESKTFQSFENTYLRQLESDEAIYGQLTHYLRHLRLATQSVVQTRGNGWRQTVITRTLAESELQPAGYVGSPQQSMLKKAYNWVRKSFRHTPAERADAKERIKQALQTLMDGGSLSGELIDALSSTYQGLHKAQGGIVAAATIRGLLRDRVSKLGAEPLAQLNAHLARERAALSSYTPAHAQILRQFYDDVSAMLRKEPATRWGADALTKVLNALAHPHHPQVLYDALDTLAQASCHMLDDQSELDFYDNALRRLDLQKRQKLHEYLNGRHGIERYGRMIDKLMAPAPLAWSQFRWHQLDTLARATAASV